MSKARWSTEAEADFDDILDYLARYNTAAVSKTESLIERAVERLRDFPEMGRVGRAVATRELPIVGTPYIVVYILMDGPLILRVLHGAQRWPASDRD